MTILTQPRVLWQQSKLRHQSMSTLGGTLNEQHRIACDVNTSPEVLKGYSSHSDTRIREAVAENHSTPEEALEVLSQDNHEDVRSYVAYNPSTTAHILEALYQGNPLPQILSALAVNPLTPPNVLRRMVSRYFFSWSTEVQRVVMFLPSNPNIPLDLLEQFAFNKEDEIRQLAAGNESLPVPLIERLVLDEHVYVREAAQRNRIRHGYQSGEFTGYPLEWVEETLGYALPGTMKGII